YGLGHAVYTKTDPRCEVFRAYVNHLAAEKGREDELALYANVEKIGKQLLMERQHKSVLSTNIDFYSGFVYEMLGLPKELYTPLFAVARIAGWSAHRMEELSVGGKPIRPGMRCGGAPSLYVHGPALNRSGGRDRLRRSRPNSWSMEIFSTDRGKTVDIWISTGYNNQAVFFRGRTFAAVLELVDRPA
ncbi:MAG: citrate/2-methylcitrate synthase, partial [Neglectibacter sp.]